LTAIAVTPFLLLFVARFKGAVKAAVHEVRNRQSDIVAVLQEVFESMRSVKAFGRQDLEQQRLGRRRKGERRSGALGAAHQIAALAGRSRWWWRPARRFVLWRGAALILAGAMTVGALTVFLAYL
jgi:ABC-type multidrug transport system fused ATPase/permease subunit